MVARQLLDERDRHEHADDQNRQRRDERRRLHDLQPTDEHERQRQQGQRHGPKEAVPARRVTAAASVYDAES